MVDRLLGIDEVAEILGVSRVAVHAGYRRWGIPYVKIGNAIRFRSSSIERWLAARESPTQPRPPQPNPPAPAPRVPGSCGAPPKLAPAQVREALRRVRDGETQKDVAASFGISARTLRSYRDNAVRYGA